MDNEDEIVKQEAGISDSYSDIMDIENPFDVISSQVQLIKDIQNIDETMYDKCPEDKIKVVGLCFKVIIAVQNGIHTKYKDKAL
jgi:hypothetical protein